MQGVTSGGPASRRKSRGYRVFKTVKTLRNYFFFNVSKGKFLIN
jgi:hypothetical protein